ncbi:MAG: hypothetical protein LAO76_09830 [Acidobacteriia bacterium]|nr:hypothetical protein [Terriglobia bacterium]
MRSAIYYPHTTIKSPDLLKRCLMLWDRVKVIVPWDTYHINYDSRVEQEAFELIGVRHYPTQTEREATHQMVRDFVKRPLPLAFSYRSVQDPNEIYEVYPQKLLPKTWELLQGRGLAKDTKVMRRRSTYLAAEPTGLALMGLLADCCAGETFARITDRSAAYAGLAGLLTASEESDVASAREELLPVSIEIANVEDLPLKTWLDLRRREESASDGASIRQLRHNLLDKLEDHAKKLAAHKDSAREELKRQFQQDMKDDYREMKEALKLEGSQILTSKEVLLSVIGGIATLGLLAGHVAVPMPDVVTSAGAAATIGGLIGSRSKFASTRRKILKEHPMAYFYEAAGGIRW